MTIWRYGGMTDDGRRQWIKAEGEASNMGVMSNSEHSARFRACKRFEGSTQETARIEMEEEGKVGRLTGTNISNDGRETDTDTESVAALCLVLWCALVCFCACTSDERTPQGRRRTRDEGPEARDEGPRLETRDERRETWHCLFAWDPVGKPQGMCKLPGRNPDQGSRLDSSCALWPLRCALEAADQRQEPTAWVGADRGCLVRYRLSPYLSRSEPRG